MLNAGRMDRLVIIQRSTATRDTMGQETMSWATHASVWAQVTPVSGNEALKENRDVAALLAKFVIRFLSTVTAKDRISYDSKYWDILSLREIGRREGLEIMAEVRA
ncbi:Head-tail adaptor protein [Gammaproteobacteria bacterium]